MNINLNTILYVFFSFKMALKKNNLKDLDEILNKIEKYFNNYKAIEETFIQFHPELSSNFPKFNVNFLVVGPNTITNKDCKFIFGEKMNETSSFFLKITYGTFSVSMHNQNFSIDFYSRLTNTNTFKFNIKKVKRIEMSEDNFFRTNFESADSIVFAFNTE